MVNSSRVHVSTIDGGLPGNRHSMQYKKSAERIVLRKLSGEGVNPNYRFRPLPPQYVVGFVDGEGSFSVSTNIHKTLKRKVEIRPEFEIELRADDAAVLFRIQRTLGCGKIYFLDYKRYGWKPHAKLRVSKINDLSGRVVPFFLKYQLQSKKSSSFNIFRKAVEMVAKKEHLTEKGYKKILALREKNRRNGKKASKIFGNR